MSRGVWFWLAVLVTSQAIAVFWATVTDLPQQALMVRLGLNAAGVAVLALADRLWWLWCETERRRKGEP